MIWALVIACFIVGCCVGTTSYCARVTAEALHASRHKHIECHDHAERVAKGVAFIISRRTLLDAANRWDSVEEQVNLKRIGREEYVPGGPTVPAIWLRELAEQMEDVFHD